MINNNLNNKNAPINKPLDVKTERKKVIRKIDKDVEEVIISKYNFPDIVHDLNRFGWNFKMVAFDDKNKIMLYYDMTNDRIAINVDDEITTYKINPQKAIRKEIYRLLFKEQNGQKKQ